MSQALISGITIGSYVAILAFVISLAFKVSRNLNLVVGDMSVLAVFVGASTLSTLQRHPVLMLGAILVGALLVSAAAWQVMWSRAAGHPFLAQVLYMFGFSLILQGAIRAVWNPDPRTLRIDLPPTTAVELWGGIVHSQTMWLVGLLMLSVLSYCMIQWRTLVGKALAATADNVVGARLTGISTWMIQLGVFAVAGGLPALAGILFGSLIAVTYASGLELTLKGVIAAMLAGLNSPLGAVISGISIGVTEALFGHFVSWQYKSAITFGVLLAILLVRPKGLGG